MNAITVENVWKRYRKGQTGYHTLREDLYNLTGRLLDFGGEKKRDADTEHVWALRDVSFEVKPGERLGIIGRNGSGKTTLLRLIAGITRPTRGKIEVRGRLGVLIEIMAGFHPELTGRENVYLNGAIMGMSRKEIKRKFDEIVAFAELEEWIDTPIKRYSSGMQVRLGFAVAAHLDPDILLIDEVLAVGDAAFQKKCLGKMEGAAQEGRTVVFVSHNMAAVRELCQRALLLDNGKIVFAGDSHDTIAYYLSAPAVTAESVAQSQRGVTILGEFFEGVERGPFGIALVPGKPFTCGLDLQVNRAPDRLWVNMQIFSIDGVPLVHVRNDFDGVELSPKLGKARVLIRFEDLPLLPGSYNLRFRLVSHYGGDLSIEDSRDLPVLVPGTKGERMKYRAFVRTRNSWEITQIRENQ